MRDCIAYDRGIYIGLSFRLSRGKHVFHISCPLPLPQLLIHYDSNSFVFQLPCLQAASQTR